MADTAKLGRLERVDVNAVWATEAGDFTPWLAGEENIAILGDTIGIDLEVEATEKNVGPFRADILCKDTKDGRWVLIENQLHKTDHTHLGQLITYASGLNAVTIVWIAGRFTDEHRSALDWLNEMTSEDINFFGLEVELWRIGNSPPAPKFNIVSSPNNWTQQVAKGAKVAEEASLTGAKKLQMEFWTAFNAFVENHDLKLRTSKPYAQNWMPISIGRTGIRLLAIASRRDSVSESYGKDEIRAEVELYDSNAKSFYSQLAPMKPQIESELGETLTWYNPDDRKVCRLYLRKVADLDDRMRWPEYHEWLLQKLVRMESLFRPLANELMTDVAMSGDNGAEV